jgi:hypothetical protein
MEGYLILRLLVPYVVNPVSQGLILSGITMTDPHRVVTSLVFGQIAEMLKKMPLTGMRPAFFAVLVVVLLAWVVLDLEVFNLVVFAMLVSALNLLGCVGFD